jgi:hypothetical protein
MFDLLIVINVNSFKYFTVLINMLKDQKNIHLLIPIYNVLRLNSKIKTRKLFKTSIQNGFILIN